MLAKNGAKDACDERAQDTRTICFGGKKKSVAWLRDMSGEGGKV